MMPLSYWTPNQAIKAVFGYTGKYVDAKILASELSLMFPIIGVRLVV